MTFLPPLPETACAAAALALRAAVSFAKTPRFENVSIDMSDPYEPDAPALAAAIRSIAAEMDARPRRMRLVFKGASRPGPSFVVDLSKDGSHFTVSVPSGPEDAARANVRRRWICEHPLPLVFASGSKTVLYATPVDANRFRVSQSPPAAPAGAGAAVAGAAVAAAGIFSDCGCLAAAGAAFAAGCALCRTGAAARLFARLKNALPAFRKRGTAA